MTRPGETHTYIHTPYIHIDEIRFPCSAYDAYSYFNEIFEPEFLPGERICFTRSFPGFGIKVSADLPHVVCLRHHEVSLLSSSATPWTVHNNSLASLYCSRLEPCWGPWKPCQGSQTIDTTSFKVEPLDVISLANLISMWNNQHFKPG